MSKLVANNVLISNFPVLRRDCLQKQVPYVVDIQHSVEFPVVEVYP